MIVRAQPVRKYFCDQEHQRKTKYENIQHTYAMFLSLNRNSTGGTAFRLVSIGKNLVLFAKYEKKGGIAALFQ